MRICCGVSRDSPGGTAPARDRDSLRPGHPVRPQLRRRLMRPRAGARSARSRAARPAAGRGPRRASRRRRSHLPYSSSVRARSKSPRGLPVPSQRLRYTGSAASGGASRARAAQQLRGGPGVRRRTPTSVRSPRPPPAPAPAARRGPLRLHVTRHGESIQTAKWPRPGPGRTNGPSRSAASRGRPWPRSARAAAPLGQRGGLGQPVPASGG